MNLNLSKKKKCIIACGVVALFIILVAVAIVIKINIPKAEVTVANVDSYEVKGEETLKFNGISVISDEQIVMVDKSQGELKDVNVKDGQEIKKGDLLFSYHNTNLEERISEYDRQITANDNKTSKAKESKVKVNANIDKLKSELTTTTGELNKVRSELSTVSELKQKNNDGQFNELLKTKDILEGNEIELSQQMDLLKTQSDGIDTKVASYEDGNKSIVAERDILKKKTNKNIVAEINGVVKVNSKSLDDPTKAYMRIISKEPLVKAEVSEFDVKNIKVNDEVMLKVVSNGEYVRGTITEIDELPIEGVERTTTGYNFYIKPEKSIRIGFNLEVKCNYKAIEIPKDYVYEKDSKLYVLKEKVTTQENIEIKAILENDKYYLLDGAIGIGDRLIKNPSTISEGSK